MRTLLSLLLLVPSVSDKPNIVVFLSDDHGYLDVGGPIRTPNMKRLADAGMTFRHAFVTSPSCAPSRASILTGLWPARHGAAPNHAAPRAEIRKLPSFLQAAGYEVAAFGKVAHYNQDKLYGFDHYDKRHAADVVRDYLEKRASGKPLCLFVGTHEPHVPWPEQTSYDPASVVVPPTHVDTPETRVFRSRYYEDVTTADRDLGAIYDLAREKLGAHVFLHMSDHGAQWPFGKWNLYDAGVRVPMFVVWPEVVKAGSTTDAMVSLADLLPSLVEIAGGAAPEGLDGTSFLPVLKDPSTAHRDRIFTTHSRDKEMNVYPIRSVRTRDWKYIRNLTPDGEHHTHIDRARARDGVGYITSWETRAKSDPAAAATVARYFKRPAEELYDLRADPLEQRNVAAGHPEILDGLRKELDAWLKSQGDDGL